MSFSKLAAIATLAGVNAKTCISNCGSNFTPGSSDYVDCCLTCWQIEHVREATQNTLGQSVLRESDCDSHCSNPIWSEQWCTCIKQCDPTKDMSSNDQDTHNTYVSWCNSKDFGKPNLGVSNCDAHCGEPYPNSSTQGWCNCIDTCTQAPMNSPD